MRQTAEWNHEWVEDTLASYLQRQYGKPLDALEVERKENRPYSSIVVLTARTKTNAHRFVLKQIASNPLNASAYDVAKQAAVEFGVMQRLYPEFVSEKRCSVPRPVGVLPDENCILMEFSDGQLLSGEMRHIHWFVSRNNFSQLRCNFHDSGQWLRRLFDFTGDVDPSTSCLDRIIQYCDHRMTVIEKLDRRLKEEDFKERVLHHLMEWSRALAGKSIPTAEVHWDFGPWNILAGPDGITVLDFFGFSKGPALLPVLSMLVCLDSFRYGAANSRQRLAELQKEFISGLGTLPDTPPALALFCEAHQRIISSAAAAVAQDGHFFNKLERLSYLRAHIRWLLNPPSRSLIV